MSSPYEIFIASSSIDKPTYKPVAEKLRNKGCGVAVYDADRVANGEIEFVADIEDGNIRYFYNGQELNPHSIDAAWYRRPSLVYYDMEDKAKRQCMTQEVQDLQGSLWDMIPDERWLNNPESIRRTEKKLGQLAVASRFGFSIPETIISNSWDRIDSRLPKRYAIAKMSKGFFYEDDVHKSMYTQVLNLDNINDLRNETIPFPAIFQTYTPKSREWRVTVIGERVFAAAIYTSEEAKDDWRAHQGSSQVFFRRENLPEDINDKCVRFLGELGLRFGAFDFIEDYEGELTYLELNPNGQYHFLEEELDMPISDAVADELIKIAKDD